MFTHLLLLLLLKLLPLPVPLGPALATRPKMKFAEHLQAHITPEWRKQYINYEVSNATDYMNVIFI